MTVLPEDEGPKSFVRSTTMVSVFPFTENSTFFKSCLLILIDPYFSELAHFTDSKYGFKRHPALVNHQATYNLIKEALPHKID